MEVLEWPMGMDYGVRWVHMCCRAEIWGLGIGIGDLRFEIGVEIEG